MAVQAQHLSYSFPHDLHAFRDPENGTTGGSLFLEEHGGCAPAVVAGLGNAVFSGVPCSELTRNDNNWSYGYVPRKRARVVAEAPAFVEGQRRVVLNHAVAQGLVPVDDVMNRAVGSGAASTSGRMANAAGLSQGLLPQFYHQGLEIDALVRLETERMRAVLMEARRHHVRAVVAAAERAAAGWLRAADAELERARCRSAELEERIRQMSAEGQAWTGVAKTHEVVAAGLRATLEQLLQSNPCAAQAGAAGEGDAEDAQSCCFSTPAGGNAGAYDDAASKSSAAVCKACGEGESCVLLLPCRHLCLCRACDTAVDTCPVCAATKNASLHVLLS